MTTLTVTVADDKDLPVLKEILNRFGLNYSVNGETDYQFSKAEIERFLKIKEEFISGKSTAKDWEEIDEELNIAYN